MNNNYYVYLHTRNDTGEVFYVGKGKNRRAWWKNQRNKHWHSIVNKVGYEVHIFKDMLTEQDAFSIEKERIQFYGRKNLCNFTDGGDGISGAIKTEAQKLHMRNKMLGRTYSKETIENMRKAAIKRCACPEYQKKRSAKLIGKHHSEEHKEKIRIAGIGRILSEESRKKISDYHKGKKKKPEAVAKTAASKSKPVLCINNNIIYCSMSEAARQLKLQSNHISDVVCGKAKHTKGFIFSLVEK